MKFTVSALALCSLLSAQVSRVAVENDRVKVLSVDVQPHAKTKLHQHKINRVMIYLQPGKQDIAYQDGKKVELTWLAGEPKWSPASGMHIAEITTDQPVTIVEIELKHPPNANTSLTGPLDPVTADPAHYHVEFENDQVRVVRVKIGPGETTKLHRHSADRIVTYLTDQDFQIARRAAAPNTSSTKQATPAGERR